MSRKLPKATAETLDEIRRQVAPPPDPLDDLPPLQAEVSALPAPRPGIVAPAAVGITATALRQAQAGEIVERHAAYAAIGGLIPLPVFDSIGVMATIVLMIQRLAKLYGEPMRRDRAKALVAGLAGGIGQAGAGSMAAVALSKFIPGANVAALMASSAAAAAATRVIGRAFVLHFETGGTALTFNEAAIRTYFATRSSSQPISRQ
ncbi:MAG: GTPase protein [Proteobacteria bacterium]|nr:GTPase protein [Pseudomonadota bacterium]